VKEVKVTGNEVVLNYTIPIMPDNLNMEKDGVLPTVRHGGPWATVPELLFEKRQLIPAIQQLLVTSLH